MFSSLTLITKPVLVSPSAAT